MGRPPTRALKIVLNPVVVCTGDPIEGVCHQHFSLGEHSNAITGGVQGIQIVGHHNDGQAQGLPQGDDQTVKSGVAIGV